MPEATKRRLSSDVDSLEADPPLIDLDTPPVAKKPRRVRWGANQTLVFDDSQHQFDNDASLLMHEDRSQDLDETVTTEVASGSSSSVTLVHDRGIAQPDNLPESDATTSAGTPSLAAIPGTADTAATVTGALGVEQSSDFVSDSESDDALLTDIAPLMARIQRKLLKRKRGRASAASATASVPERTMPAMAVDYQVPANHVQARFTAGRDGINKGQPDQAKEEDESRKTSSTSSKNGGGAAVANRFLRKSWTPVRKSVAESVPPQNPSSGPDESNPLGAPSSVQSDVTAGRDEPAGANIEVSATQRAIYRSFAMGTRAVHIDMKSSEHKFSTSKPLMARVAHLMGQPPPALNYVHVPVPRAELAKLKKKDSSEVKLKLIDPLSPLTESSFNPNTLLVIAVDPSNGHFLFAFGRRNLEGKTQQGYWDQWLVWCSVLRDATRTVAESEPVSRAPEPARPPTRSSARLAARH